MAARPLISTVSVSGASAGNNPLPDVFFTPVRLDIVQAAFTNMNKNKRQSYAVNPLAGHNVAAKSWGTGRAVARIPRVSGGGTSRSGQGAFGNMCKGGRMFAPTKIYRKWTRKTNLAERRFATSAALAASGVPSLLMARGHRVSNVAEVPCVVSDDIESISKTSDAIALLKTLGADEDVERVKKSRKMRRGKGKMRNRRFRQGRGPLVIFNNDNGISNAVRNISGVEARCVTRLGLLDLAPGGHIGRFVIFSESAFKALDSVFGTTKVFAEGKKGWKIPAPMMANADVARIINSDEIQSVVRDPKVQKRSHNRKKNPLKNLGAMVKLNPYALAAKRAGAAAAAKKSGKKSGDRKAQKDKFHASLVADL